MYEHLVQNKQWQIVKQRYDVDILYRSRNSPSMHIFWFALALCAAFTRAQQCTDGCSNERAIESQSCGESCKSYTFPRMLDDGHLPAVSNILLKIPDCVDASDFSSDNVTLPFSIGGVLIESECNLSAVFISSNYTEDNPNCQDTRDDFNGLSVLKIEFDTENCEDPINVTMSGTVWAENCPMGFFLGFKGGQECCSCSTDGLVCPETPTLLFMTFGK